MFSKRYVSHANGPAFRVSLPRACGLALLTCAAAMPSTHAGESADSALAHRHRLIDAVNRENVDPVPELIEALEHASESVFLTAAHLIATLDPPVREALDACLRSDRVAVRRVGIRALAARGLLPEYWDRIIADDAPSIRRETRLALLDEHIRPLAEDKRKRVLDAFDRVYREGDAPTRMHIVEMLGALLLPGETGWALLERGLKDEDPDIRYRAAQLSIRPRLDRTEKLTNARAWETLADEFADADPVAWPDPKMARSALFRRARAYNELKRHADARADLEQATKLMHYRIDLIRLGDTLMALDEREKALDAYTRAIGRPEHGSNSLTEMLAAAYKAFPLMEAMGRPEQVLAAMETIESQRPILLETASGQVAYRLLGALGRSLVELGRAPEAIDRFRQALEQGGLDDNQRAEFEKAIEALKASDIRNTTQKL